MEGKYLMYIIDWRTIDKKAFTGAERSNLTCMSKKGQ